MRSLLGVDGRLRPAVDAGSDGPYAFLETQADGTPVGFSPCVAVPYVVNPDGAPEGWEDDVRHAVDEVSDRTGLEFDDGGVTDDRDFSGRGREAGRTDPVLIGWADEDEVDALADDVAGIGGPSVVAARQPALLRVGLGGARHRDHRPVRRRRRPRRPPSRCSSTSSATSSASTTSTTRAS